MINRVYQLVAPKQIAVKFRDLSLTGDNIIVRPRFLSICAADQRYYQGLRSPEALRKKLPMAIIHECCGEVAYDPTGRYSCGQKVLLVPNEPTRARGIIRENYDETSKFRASGYDGFMQEYVGMIPECVVPYSNICDPVAAISELISVAMHAVTTFLSRAHEARQSCAVFGDGNLGYIVALLLKTLAPETELHVFGVMDEKLAFFSFADKVHRADAIEPGLRVDHAFECVGGSASGSVISSIIDIIRPEGTIMLMGVSENPVPVNTRMVLERGLTLIGRSRSTTEDFIAVRDLLESRPELQDKLNMIVREVLPVSDIPAMSRAFDRDFTSPFKTVMQWLV